jgi:hypothetical protein
MKTIRRLYFYAIAAISIEVVMWGIINLLRSILGQQITDSASALAQALSLILVGVPIFLIHWLWAQRVSARDEEEKTASLRAVFLYGILLGTLIPVAQNLLALINRAFLSAANLYTSRAIFGGTQTWIDNLIAIVINALIAAYFWNILQNEWRTIPEKHNFIEVRRLARFIWMLYGLLFVVYGAQQALSYAFTFSSQTVLGAVGRETIVNAIAMLVIGSPIWFFAWKMLQDALNESTEKESLLRLGILYLLSLGGVITVLTAGGNLLYMILMRLLGDGKTFTEFVQDIGGPISIGVPFVVIWMYYGTWLHHQFAFDDDLPRRAGKQRMYFYILSLLGLGASIFAVISLFGVVIELLTVKGYLSASGFGDSLSNALAFLAAGLPLWLLTWRPMQALALEAGAMGDHARRSVIRKTYLYLVLFASVIGVMVSAGGLIYTLIKAALDGQTTDLLNSVLNALQALVVFAVVLTYHLFALRKDTELRADELESKQKGFNLAVFDHDGKFGEALKSVFAKRAPDVSVNIVNVNSIPADLKPDAVLFSSRLLADSPTSSNASAWIRSFGGTRLAVEEDAAGIFWMNDAHHAVDSVRALAEGQQIRPRAKGASAWMIVVYICAALFAVEFLFVLTMIVISSLYSGF